MPQSPATPTDFNEPLTYQIRVKGHDDHDIYEAALAAADACRSHRAPFIVNDRADVALAVGADGVHIGQRDLPPRKVRKIMGDDAIIGLSTHSEQEIMAAQREPVDYIGVGPVYPSPTKEGWEPVGTELVRFAAENSRLPFFAIGGINSGNVAEVLEAGAQRVAVTRAIADAANPRSAVEALLRILNPEAGLE